MKLPLITYFVNVFTEFFSHALKVEVKTSPILKNNGNILLLWLSRYMYLKRFLLYL